DLRALLLGDPRNAERDALRRQHAGDDQPFVLEQHNGAVYPVGLKRQSSPAETAVADAILPAPGPARHPTASRLDPSPQRDAGGGSVVRRRQAARWWTAPPATPARQASRRGRCRRAGPGPGCGGRLSLRRAQEK